MWSNTLIWNKHLYNFFPQSVWVGDESTGIRMNTSKLMDSWTSLAAFWKMGRNYSLTNPLVQKGQMFNFCQAPDIAAHFIRIIIAMDSESGKHFWFLAIQ